MSQSASFQQQSVVIQDQQTLINAFEQFSRLSEQLQKSYEDLDRRSAELTAELASTRDERINQLAEKEQLADRLAKLLTALPAGVVVVDEHDRIHTSNEAAEAFFEMNLQGRRWRHVLQTNIESIDAEDVILKNGRILSINKQALDDSGEIILINDVSNTRMLQNLASRQNRLASMGQMAAGLAHQLRTPLSSAVLYTSQLDKLDIHPSQQKKAVEKIRTSLRYLEKLINDMLMYAKGGEFNDVSFSLNKLLVAFNARIESRLQVSHTQLKIISSLDEIILKGSIDALVSVLCNLAENAIEACHAEDADKQCQIELEVYQQMDHLILAMRDNGPGLTAEQQKHIFEPFYTERMGGTGLGLAVAQSIVQAHHGDLLVRSSLERGSTFYLCLPLNKGEQFLPSGQMTPPLNMAGQKSGEIK